MYGLIRFKFENEADLAMFCDRPEMKHMGKANFAGHLWINQEVIVLEEKIS